MDDIHAKRFGVFCWIYAGLITLTGIASLISLTLLLRDLSPPTFSFESLMHEFDQPWGYYHYIAFAFFGFVIFEAALIVSAVLANFRMGSHLRKGVVVSKRSVVVTSILTALSSVFGGLLLLPIGIALGAYGIWFAMRGIRDGGKCYDGK